jgi:hypothetical protein
MKGSIFQPPKTRWKIPPWLYEVSRDRRYDHINLFGKSKHVSTLVLPRISCIALGLALLEDE